jgi:hypothetical protein
MGEQPLDLVAERRQIGQVHEANGAAADLVLIGRADAALGGADAGGRAVGLAQGFELAMQRQDQRRVFRDTQIVRGHRYALFLQLRDFIEQSLRVNHHAVADDRQLALAHHARRQQRKLIGGAVDDQRMSRIVPALKADHDVGLFGQPVDDLPFTLVAPLRPHDNNIRHWRYFPAPAFGRLKPGSRRPGPLSDNGSGRRRQGAGLRRSEGASA